MSLRAPFPWFGGKSRAAHIVWPRFGDAPNYIEPFAGSLAVLLAREGEPRVETVNDLDAYLSNAWRAMAADPDGVARYADWPVNEVDLHARHRWLVESAAGRVEQVRRDPDYYDVKVAGWWLYGQCLWIGSGFCARPEWTGRAHAGARARGINSDSIAERGQHRWQKRPNISDSRGVHSLKHANGANAERCVDWEPRPDLSSANGRGGMSSARRLAPEFSRMGDVLNQQRRPQLTSDNGIVGRRPNMGGAGGGQGVQAPRLTRTQIPQLSGDGSGSQRGYLSDGVQDASGGLFEYMRELSARLRRVRVCCGDWRRVLTPAVTTYIGRTAVLLDPPYDHSRRTICYANDQDISADVREWALANGDNPDFMIALCGYEGEHVMPDSWECKEWVAGGGYGRSERGKANREAERIWFSPHCLRPTLPLFEHLEEVSA